MSKEYYSLLEGQYQCQYKNLFQMNSLRPYAASEKAAPESLLPVKYLTRNSHLKPTIEEN